MIFESDWNCIAFSVMVFERDWNYVAFSLVFFRPGWIYRHKANRIFSRGGGSGKNPGHVWWGGWVSGAQDFGIFSYLFWDFFWRKITTFWTILTIFCIRWCLCFTGTNRKQRILHQSGHAIVEVKQRSSGDKGPLLGWVSTCATRKKRMCNTALYCTLRHKILHQSGHAIVKVKQCSSDE